MQKLVNLRGETEKWEKCKKIGAILKGKEYQGI
jgi:hypothetical protein